VQCPDKNQKPYIGVEILLKSLENKVKVTDDVTKDNSELISRLLRNMTKKYLPHGILTVL
jgi:hypothetical protein